MSSGSRWGIRLTLLMMLRVVTLHMSTAHWCDVDHIPWSEDGKSVKIPVGCATSDDEAINLSAASLGSRAVEILAAALATSRARRLILEDNHIGRKGAAALGALLAKNTRLISLDISRNKIGDDGAREIAEGLRNNTHLRKLMLGDNGIGPHGAEAIAQAIGDGWRRENFDQISKLGKGKKVSGNFIVDLWLSFNPIGDGGAVVLAEILSGNTSVSGSGVVSDGTVGRPGVEQIFLAHCGIGNYGAASLGSALVLNPHMTNLVLIGNPIEKVLRAPIEAAMSINNNVRRKYRGQVRDKASMKDFNAALWQEYFSQQQHKASPNSIIPIFNYNATGGALERRRFTISWNEMPRASPTSGRSTASTDDIKNQNDESISFSHRPVRVVLSGAEVDEADDEIENPAALPHMVEQRKRIIEAKALSQAPPTEEYLKFKRRQSAAGTQKKASKAEQKKEAAVDAQGMNTVELEDSTS